MELRVARKKLLKSAKILAFGTLALTVFARDPDDPFEKALRAEAKLCPISIARRVQYYAHPLKQWLHWMTRANLGARNGYHDLNIDDWVPVPVRLVPKGDVKIELFTEGAGNIKDLFDRDGFIALPNHPFSSKDWTASPSRRAAARATAVSANWKPDEVWMAHPTASRAMVMEWRDRLIGIKMPTDHPNPVDRQPEKFDMSELVKWAPTINRRIEDVDRALGGPDPRLIILKEVAAVSFKRGGNGFLVRDYGPLKKGMADGKSYLPAHAIEFVNPELWVDYATATARARAILALRYGMRLMNPHRQQWFLELDAKMRPTGTIVAQDVTDSHLIDRIADWHGHSDWVDHELSLGADFAPNPDIRPVEFEIGEVPQMMLHDRIYQEEMAKLLGVEVPKKEKTFVEAEYIKAHEQFEARERARMERLRGAAPVTPPQ